ncbi:class I SAM-dependent methyltransferase [Pseudanabaena yagii]|uniref:Class I SAM-dependent methyltransferase n=1 Tax=Pseudanabaena yagii GIHE-NHR1 TaxID=2722753 RepID=A0ABX1LWM2_9CYAN|nr:class I SAM-dependent methyltransferase [Pseudanabaena yagii]NMF60559.1 class I SAM-dependent methyltransferase [Pseudanabaena yagii GIHE-NHR1]
MINFKYIGKELDGFAQATNWKNYIKFLIAEFIHGYVLEVGAGIGNNTTMFLNCQYYKWLCLEPDDALLQVLKLNFNLSQSTKHNFLNGTINNLEKNILFDSILYIDVLEHIYKDNSELIKATQLLNTNGSLIVLSPAHQCLFSSFDSSIGHYRRYNKSMIRKILPHNIEITKLIYLDCVGLIANIVNKLFLKQRTPSLKQIQFWDNFMVPISRKIDPLIFYSLGKSVLLIGKKSA